MAWQLAAAALVLFLIVQSEIASRRQRRQLLENLRTQWGTPHRRPRNMGAIAEYHAARIASDRDSPATSIDTRTWEDLDLDAVFAALDHTQSSIGQQVLYHRLRTAPAAPHLEAFDALATLFQKEVATREAAQSALARLRNPAGYDLWWLAQPGSIVNERWTVLFPIVGAGMLVTLILGLVWHGVLLLLLVGAAINLPLRAFIAGRIGGVIGSFRQLGPLLAAADVLVPLVRGLGPPPVATLPDDLARLGKLRTVAGWVARDPSAAGELASAMFELLNTLFQLDANALYFGARELAANGDALLRVVGAVGEIDAALSVASVRSATPFWTRPQFGPPGTAVDIVGLRHPLVEDAVPNSVRLDALRGMLITGSNMSGKSTFVRAVGVNVVLAQTICTAFASAYDAPVLLVASCLERSDDLQAGKSYYLVEVESVLALVRAGAGAVPCLFLLDELFRGTNAVERVAAGEAVLTQLAAQRPSGPVHAVIAATHDAELVELLRDTFDPFHLADSLGRDGLVFEFRLKPGAATTRNAIALLRLKGAPPALVDQALRRAAVLDEQRARGREAAT